MANASLSRSSGNILSVRAEQIARRVGTAVLAPPPCNVAICAKLTAVQRVANATADAHATHVLRSPTTLALFVLSWLAAIATTKPVRPQSIAKHLSSCDQIIVGHAFLKEI